MIEALNGSAYTLAAAPLLPWWVVAVLTATAALVLALGLWRRAGGVWWRAAAALMLLALWHRTTKSLAQTMGQGGSNLQQASGM